MPADSTHRLACVGSYTSDVGGRGRGIRTYRQDTRNGELEPADSLSVAAPSFVLWHPELPVVYVAHELADGAVSAMRVADDGALTSLGSLPTGGAEPCHLAFAVDGHHLFSSNYGGGSITVFRLGDEGELETRTDVVQLHGSGADPERQDAAHLHMVVPSPEAPLLNAVDLGTDRVHTYRLGLDGLLSAVGVSVLPAGTGPRELVRRGIDGDAFIVAELGAAVLRVTESPGGQFTVVESISVAAPAGEPRNYPAHAVISDDGRVLYLSNRGAGTIVAMDLENAGETVTTSYPSGGSWPRHFAISDGYLYACQERDDAITAFAIDQRSGAISRLHSHPTGSPTCIAFR